LALGTLGTATSAYIGTCVKVLLLWDYSNDTGAAQAQLVLNGSVVPGDKIPVADGGVTASLLGMSFLG
jgi:hypothetical protein